MQYCAKIGMWMAIILSLFSGCAAHQGEALSSESPMEIYLAPDRNNLGGARVGIFPFSGPDYAPEIGHAASEILCNELVKCRAFREVILQPDQLNMTMGNLVDIARIKRLDLIITGRLLNCFEGTALEPSRVSEEIRVIAVRGGRPRVLWHARTSETVSPERSKDWVLFLSDGQPAPATAALMKKNAEKFCRMILTLPQR